MVFYYSLKDVRSTAPKMSCGSRAGQSWPTALTIPIRATQPDIAFRCCWALLPVRKSAADIFWQKLDTVDRSALARGEQSRFYAQET